MDSGEASSLPLSGPGRGHWPDSIPAGRLAKHPNIGANMGANNLPTTKGSYR